MGNYIVDKSFQLLRTNTRLTTNVKINVDTNFDLYLESFNANKTLSDDKYKHFSISEQSYLEDKIPLFYDGISANIAYDVRDFDDEDIVYKNYSDQFDDLYWSGVKKIEQNKFYKEEFEYFAPLYLKYGNLPDNFIIMRVDDPVVYEETSTDYSISSTNKGNFKKEVINKWKIVSSYDLTIKSKLGNWLDRNFINNERFPTCAFEFDSNSTNFSRWYGIDYTSGAYSERGQFITDKIRYEQPHFRLEEYITDGYKRNNIIYPNILNLNYLFDDNPATPFKYNKYSINRYYGFYVDLDKVEVLTSYIQEELRTDINLKMMNNVFMIDDLSNTSVNPFYISDGEWDDNKEYYIYVKDDLFEVKKVKIDGGYSYNILSKYDVNIGDITKSKEIRIEYFEDSSFNYQSTVIFNNGHIDIDRLITENDSNILYADLYLIEINNDYHIIEYIDDEYILRTDYGIESDNLKLKTWKGGDEKSVYLIQDTINHEKPLIYPIYRVKFRDIKDFDTNYIDSGFANFDFNRKDEYVETEEHKLYCVEHLDASENTVFKKYGVTDPNFNKIRIASSEYVADDELYEINKNGLTNIWRKNSNNVKWGFEGSISHSSYPYKLNNSNKVGSTFNRTTNVLSKIPDIISKTNDYFYRIGTFISGGTSGYSYNYEYFDTQSLSIESDSFSDNGESVSFDLDKYIKSDYDYFEYFLNNTRYINNNKDKVKEQHYSIINGGSKYNTSTTLFNGIKYSFDRITSVIRDNNGNIEKYLTDLNYNFNGYKFCVIGNYYGTDYTPPTYDQNLVTKEYYGGVYTSIPGFTNNPINILFNEKYKNILVIVNLHKEIDKRTITLNNYDAYTKEVIYNGKGKYYDAIDIDIQLSIANIFMGKINDNLNTYYFIDNNGNSGVTINTNTITVGGNMKDVWGNSFSPIKINTLKIDQLKLKKKSFNVSALKGPKTNIYDKFKIDFTEPIYEQSFIKEPLSRIIKINEKELSPRPQHHGERLIYDKSIYRYSGSYEPIFNTVDLYNSIKFIKFDSNDFSHKKCGNKISGVTSGVDSIPWFYDDNNCNNSNIMISELLLSGVTETTVDSYFLTIDNFDFNIPTGSVISGIEINIDRFCDDINNSNIEDVKLILTKDGSEIGNASSNVVWGLNEIKIYGGSSDLWGNNGIDFNDFNLSKIGIKYKVKMKRLNNTPAMMINKAIIKCLCMRVYFTLNTNNNISYRDYNVIFDDKLYKFGEIDNLIYSKVNENTNMLKLKDTKEDKSIYPMIDEYGYNFDKKFIFKSNWDNNYYQKTKKEI